MEPAQLPPELPVPQGILSLSTNTQIFQTGGIYSVVRTSGDTICLEFAVGPAFVLRQEQGDWFVLPSEPGHSTLAGDSLAWVLPLAVDDSSPAWLVKGPAGCPVSVQIVERIRVEVRANAIELHPYENRPHADIFGSRYTLQIEDGALLERALAAFYWDTLLPCVVERTRAAGFPTPNGYVLSTLAPGSYPGTYPDVDHEFQVKGRLAAGSPLDEDVARRMMELQFQVMRADPQGLWRNPCSVQSDGRCEYHVRRNSLNGAANAIMFLVTGNVEILEEAWQYVAATRNRRWLEARIPDLEGAARGIEDYIDQYGRLWSDVYFEDQVMQDGRVCDAQAFAANGFRLLAELEHLLGRIEQAGIYQSRSKQLALSLVEALPRGYWDADQERFANWVDRHGAVHDHIHLLSNELPALFGFADMQQEQAVLRLIDENREAFQRFPSFVALDLAGYTESEIGDGGPYDLCAAGRYWCWDAAFWAWRGDGGMLHRQLVQVARQAEREGYRMGERYDMDYVYYVDGVDWHGAAHYYEYPCVFTWVLMHDYLGVAFALDVDLVVAPCLPGWGRVELHAARFAVAYTLAPEGFTLQNLADRPRTFRIDLSALYLQSEDFVIEQGTSIMPFSYSEQVTLQPGETCVIKNRPL